MAKDQIQEICSKLLAMFESGDLPPAIARTVIQRQQGDNKPSDRWSFCNQLIMVINGSLDSRGYRQWAEVGRSVKHGAKAFYILAPMTATVTRAENLTQEGSGDGKAETQTIIKGFRAVPVFRFEDTEGDPVSVADYRPPELPPLYEVAEHFGLVRYTSYFNRELGSCSVNGAINLYSHDVDVFFHELGHQVHSTIRSLKGGQHSEQELVAEMVSCVLCELYGYQGYLWQGWNYIKSYSDMESAKALKAIMSVLSEVAAVATKILLVEEQLRPPVATVV